MPGADMEKSRPCRGGILGSMSELLQLAELQQLFPVAVDFLLDLLDHPLVAGLEHVSETALHLQILLNGLLLLGLVAQDILALDDLGLSENLFSILFTVE